LKYRKHFEDKEVSDTIQFLDRHGKEIPACIEYNSETGYTTVYELPKKRKEYQFNTEACAACGAAATAIPNPPAIKAPIIARNFRINGRNFA
jgi:hypothetical protein